MTTTVTDRFPIVDTETGEVIATTQEELDRWVRHQAHIIIEHDRRAASADDARRRLATVMDPTDPPVAVDGWTVACEPPAPAKRGVNRHAIDAHLEALGPIGLAPREEVTRRYPGVGDITSTRARAALAQAGISAASLLLEGHPGAPRIIVRDPEGKVST